ncbi:MAG TPA: glycosyltransferase [Bryobacteraceae bacterium]
MIAAPKLLYVFPGFGGGGAQLRMVSIMNALGDSFSHRIIALDGNLGAAAALSPDIDATVEGPPTPKAGALAFRSLVNSLLPAAVLTYNWGAIEATIGARMAGVCPVIHNECGFGPEEATTLKRRRVWTRRLVLNSIFQTVVTSANMLRIAGKEFRLPPHKARLIQTGVDASRYRPCRNPALRRAWGVADREILFGYLGGLRPEKNLELLLRAFHEAALPEAKLALAGVGSGRVELERLAAELDLGDRVIFAGHQSDAPAYLAALDIFTMSSITEQVSNAQLEAMAAGLPVICTDVGDSRELLGGAADGCVVASRHQTAYAAALRRLAVNSERRAESGAANRRRAVEYYSRDRMVREYAELLQSAASHRLKPVPPSCPTQLHEM